MITNSLQPKVATSNVGKDTNNLPKEQIKTYESLKDALFETASEYHSYQLQAVPCKGKRPALSKWTQWQKQTISPKQLQDLFNTDFDGIGFICGAISGNLEVIDIDIKGLPPDQAEKIWLSYIRSIKEYDRELFNSLVIERSQSGGKHIYYRCNEIQGNQDLSFIIAEDTQKLQKVFETRGEGGFIVADPTKGYAVFQNDFSSIPTITPTQRKFLLDLARSYDQKQPEIRQDKPQHAPQIEIKNISRATQKTVSQSIDNAINLIANSVDGEKNTQLLKASQILGGLVGGGFLAESEAFDIAFLEISKKPNVASLENARKTIKAGITHGKTKPITTETITQNLKDYLATLPQTGPVPSSPPTEQATTSTAMTPKEQGQANNIPFPIDALPTVFSSLCKQAHDRKLIPLEFTACSILGIASALIGNSYKVELDGETQPAMLWVVLLGNSSSGKTRALKLTMPFLFEIQEQFQKEYEKDLANYKADQEYARQNKQTFTDEPPIKKSIYMSGFTYEALEKNLKSNPKGILIYKNEVVALLKSFNQYRAGGDTENMLSLWDGDPIKKDLTSKDIFVSKPFASIIGGTQPSKLIEFGKDGKDQDGFLFRFLFSVCPPKNTPNQYNTQKIDKDLIDDYKRALVKLHQLSFTGDTIQITLCSDAKSLFVNWFNENEKLKFNLNNDALDSMYGKLADYLLRLSLVIELLGYSVGSSDLSCISANSVKQATKLIEYFRLTGEHVLNELHNPKPNGKGLSPKETKFINLLPQSFTALQAKEKGEANGLPFPTKSIYRILNSLVTKGYIYKDDDNTYHLN